MQRFELINDSIGQMEIHISTQRQYLDSMTKK